MLIADYPTGRSIAESGCAPASLAMMMIDR
jgi:hypothetical protein